MIKTDVSPAAQDKKRSLLQRKGFHPFVCNDYGFNQAVFIKVHFIHAHHTCVAVGLVEWPAVINNKPLVGAGWMYHGMMSRTGGYFRILLQNFSNAFEGPKGESAMAYATL